MKTTDFNEEKNSSEKLDSIFSKNIFTHNDQSINIWNTENDMTYDDVLAEEMANILFAEYMNYLNMNN